jgi:hypothetical protein
MDDIDAYLDQTAAILGLKIDPAYRPGVRGNLERTFAIAKAVTEFDLPDELEAAPVWRPEGPKA